MLTKTRVVALLGALAFAGATAADSKLYFGIGAGVSQVLTSSRDLSEGLQARGHNVDVDLDANEPGGEVYIGYKILPELAMELSLVTLGEFESRITGTTNDLRQLQRDAAELQPKGNRAGPALAAAARLPWTDDLSVLIRMGLFYWDAETEVVNGTSTVTFEDDGVDPLIGLGLQYQMSKRWVVGTALQGFFIEDDLVYLFTGNLEYHLK